MTENELSKIHSDNIRILRETEDYICSGKTHLSAEEMSSAQYYDAEETRALRYQIRDHIDCREVKTVYNVVAYSSVDTALMLKGHYRENILVLNFASSTHPGGGVRHGARAQEETLCRQTTLLQSLESKHAREYYDRHREKRTYLASDAIVFSPKVEILRDGNNMWLQESNPDFVPTIVSVLTCAAPHLFENTHDSEEDLSQLYYQRILGMLCVAIQNNCCNLVLGAWGCGAFHNNPELVADAFCKALMTVKTELLSGRDFFEIVFFAVPNASSKNYRAFKNRIEKLKEEIDCNK